VGYHYQSGKDVRVDFAEAEQWWLQSASAGNITAQQALGTLAHRKDMDKAIEWWLKAANAGDSMPSSISWFFSEKLGTPEALEWITKSAVAGIKVLNRPVLAGWGRGEWGIGRSTAWASRRNHTRWPPYFRLEPVG
jgi:TPR repeat protein